MMRRLSAWQNREAFEYMESLDGPLLAWEYLRRNSAYRNAWSALDPDHGEAGGRDWGLLRLIDPTVDARTANPNWQPDPPSTMRVIRAAAHVDGLRLYDLQIGRSAPNEVHDDDGAYVTALVGSDSWRVHLADDLNTSDRVAIAIPVDEYARRRIAAADQFIQALEQRSVGARKRAVLGTRTACFHGSVLRALDGAAAGATHREIAVAIFGARSVAKRWTPDGDLRARVRYFLKRGAVLVDGDYRTLIYR